LSLLLRSVLIGGFLLIKVLCQNSVLTVDDKCTKHQFIHLLTATCNK